MTARPLRYSQRPELMAMRKGESKMVSKGTNGSYVTVERSTDGKVIRYVRTFGDGSWEVFKTVNVAGVK